MFFFQDEKDNLRDTLSELHFQINRLDAKLSHKVDILTQRIDSLTHPYGPKKDGTPRAKPGRKPKGETA